MHRRGPTAWHSPTDGGAAPGPSGTPRCLPPAQDLQPMEGRSSPGEAALAVPSHPTALGTPACVGGTCFGGSDTRAPGLWS